MSRKMFLGFALCFCVLIGLLSLSSISHTEEGKWTRKSDMPTARASFATSVVNGKVYAIGGADPWPIPISTVEEYDPVTDTWTKKADMPTARKNLSTSVVNGKIYAIGGQANPDEGLSTVEEYDPVKDTWTKKANMSTARAGLSTSTINGTLYAIGGKKTWGEDLSIVEEYNPITNSWKAKSQMPTPRRFLSTSVVNGKIYAFGGTVGGGIEPLRCLPIVEEYNPITDKWTGKAKMPFIPCFIRTHVINGKVYAIVGVIERGWEVEEYDPMTEIWRKKSDMPSIKGAFSTGVVNGKIYVIGGLSGNVLISTVEEYDPGFESEGIEAKGKFVTSWGELKAKY